jgi:hypothetical protein
MYEKFSSKETIACISILKVVTELQIVEKCKLHACPDCLFWQADHCTLRTTVVVLLKKSRKTKKMY